VGANWKQDLHDQLANAKPGILPDGAVEVEVAWRCRPTTGLKWLSWWKPTGDAMGPVLGQPYPQQPFNPSDDHIVSLALHLITDLTMDNAVDVGMWWRSHDAKAV